MDKRHGINYRIIAIILGVGLIGGTLLGQSPVVYADDDDHKEKLKKLKELIKKWKQKHKDKCPEKFKYNGVCDKQKPRISILEPDWFEKLPEGIVTFEIEASDAISGIKKVEVKIPRVGTFEATHISGDIWELDVDLEKGRHVAIAKAIDNVGNSKRDIVVFRVI